MLAAVAAIVSAVWAVLGAAMAAAPGTKCCWWQAHLRTTISWRQSQCVSGWHTALSLYTASVGSAAAAAAAADPGRRCPGSLVWMWIANDAD